MEHNAEVILKYLLTLFYMTTKDGQEPDHQLQEAYNAAYMIKADAKFVADLMRGDK